MNATLQAPARCACGADATANGRECGSCFRERLGTVHSGFAPSRSAGAGQVDPVKTRRFENRLEDYRAVRYEGSQPRTTRRRDIDATKAASDVLGSAVRHDRVGR